MQRATFGSRRIFPQEAGSEVSGWIETYLSRLLFADGLRPVRVVHDLRTHAHTLRQSRCRAAGGGNAPLHPDTDCVPIAVRCAFALCYSRVARREAKHVLRPADAVRADIRRLEGRVQGYEERPRPSALSETRARREGG